MTTKADFTDEEWEDLQRGVSGAGLLVSLSDPGFFDTFKEAGAMARHFADARREDSSDLVKELAASRPKGFGIGTKPPELEAETLEALRSAASLLRAKAPDDLAAYREFVLDVARSVAEAAGGVAARETDVITKIEAALESGG